MTDKDFPSDVRERIIQAHIEGYNNGYDTCKEYLLKKINRMHDVEFYALSHLLEDEMSDNLAIRIARKTWEVATLEKVRDALEAM